MSKNKTLSLLAAITGNEDLTTSEVKDIVEDVVEKSQEEIAEMAADLAVKEIEGEVEKLDREVEKVTDAVEEIEENLEELEEVVEGVEALLASGSYNPTAVGYLYSRAEKLNKQLGGNSPVVVLGAESLADATTAALTLREGLESFTDTIKKHASGAAAFIKSIYNAVISWFKGLTDEAVALAKSIKATQDSLNKVEKLKENVSGGNWAAAIKVADTTKLKSVISAINEVARAVNSVTEGSHATYAAAYAKLVAAVKGQNGEEKDGKIVVVMGAYELTFKFYSGDIAKIEDIAVAGKETGMSYTIDKEKLSKAKSEFTTITSKQVLADHLRAASKQITEITGLQSSVAASEKGRDDTVAALKKLEGKEAPWVNAAIKGVKQSCTFTTSMFNQSVKVLNELGKARIAVVKAHI